MEHTVLRGLLPFQPVSHNPAKHQQTSPAPPRIKRWLGRLETKRDRDLYSYPLEIRYEAINKTDTREDYWLSSFLLSTSFK